VSAAPVVLVTGAGTRVGRAIAVHLGARGWRVAVHYFGSEEGARGTVAAIEAAGGAAAAFRADLREADAPHALVEAVVARCGALDALIPSAAGFERAALDAVEAAHVDRVLALNLRAPLLLAQAAAPALRRSARGGAIVLIGDHLAEEPHPAYLVHGVAKGGVLALARHLAVALAPDVRVNAVSPGYVLAPPGHGPAEEAVAAEATLLGRVGTPADVASAVAFLLDAPYVTGEVLRVDGGRRVRG
jgi:pteridine reductase